MFLFGSTTVNTNRYNKHIKLQAIQNSLNDTNRYINTMYIPHNFHKNVGIYMDLHGFAVYFYLRILKSQVYHPKHPHFCAGRKAKGRTAQSH